MDERCYRSQGRIKGLQNPLQKAVLSLLLLCCLLPFVITLPVLAATISGAEYGGTLLIASNNTSSASGVVALFTLNTDELIDDDYINSNLNNTAILTAGGADTAYMPVPGTSNWTVWVSSIAGSSSLNYLLYTGGPAMNGTLRYIPYTTGMTATDSNSTELGNNFTIEQKGYVDTSQVGANLTIKQSAVRTYVSGEGSITSTMTVSETPTDLNLVPNAVGDYTNIASSTEATHWEAVDDPPASPDTTTYVYTTSETQEKDAYNLEDGSVPYYSQINSVTVYFKCYHSSVTGHSKFQPFLRLGTNETAGTEETKGSSGWESYSEELGRPGGGDWQVSDIPDLQVAIGLLSTDTARCTYIYVKVNYTLGSLSVTATGISSGEHTVKTYADATNLGIIVDEGEAGEVSNTTALGGASVNNTATNWTFCQNGAIPYLEYQKIWVNGTLVQHIVYEYNTTFTDLSGYNNTATPTFYSTSSDSNVTAALVSFLPLDPAELSGYTLDPDAEIINTTPTQPAEMYGELNTIHLPGADLVNSALTEGDIPLALFWIPATIGLAAAIGFIVYGFTNSLLMQAAVSAFIMFGFAITGGGIIPWWTPVIFIVEAFGIIIARKQISW